MKKRLCLLDLDYFVENNKAIIRLWCKGTKGENVTVFERDFFPYFFIEAKDGSDTESLKKRILSLNIEGYSPTKIEKVTKNYLGKEKNLIKVYIKIPADVLKFKKRVSEWKDVRKTYEYDVNFSRRYMIDNDLVPMCWYDMEFDGPKLVNIEKVEKEDYPILRVMAFDIELVEENDVEKIIMISIADSGGYKKVISYGKRSKVSGVEIVKNEGELIQRFIEIVNERDADIITGYNSDMFDFNKLNQRARELKIDLRFGRDSKHLIFKRRGMGSAAIINGRVHIDLYNFIRNVLSSTLSTESLTLDKVSKELIGKGKDPLDWKDIEKAWRKRDVKRIAKYCQKDSLLTLELSEYLLPQIFELARVTGQTIFDMSRMSYSQLVEWLYIRKAREVGEIVPNRPSYEEIQMRRKVSYLGGYVHSPREGIHEKIGVFDFASLYPSITVTHNISPETLDCDCCKGGKNNVPELKHHYCTKKSGFVTNIIEDLVLRRIEMKNKLKLARDNERKSFYNNRQYALKILANASYGYYAYSGSRWYSKVCAESITSLGRMYIKKVILLAERGGYWVIYGDTDSLFLKMKQKDIKQFIKDVNFTLPGIMEVEFKGFYQSGIFVLGKGGVAAKKRYALIDSKGEMIIRGFEIVRRDWSAIARETQQKVLLAVLKDKKPEKAVKIVRKIIKDISKGKINHDDLIIYTQLTKPIHEYEQIGPHVAAAKRVIERGEQVRVGATIEYIITKGSGTISERAEPADYAENYDPEYYINNQVLPAAMRILAGLGYREADFIIEKKEKSQQSLDDYIK